mmetsp:Transcript_120268/g.300012  ORF Transcript_120268/g.300012 Transcript_120268/m.300012 type:complete len:224 (+) Transcript_120268:1746-2417(+)
MPPFPARQDLQTNHGLPLPRGEAQGANGLLIIEARYRRQTLRVVRGGGGHITIARPQDGHLQLLSLVRLPADHEPLRRERERGLVREAALRRLQSLPIARPEEQVGRPQLPEIPSVCAVCDVDEQRPHEHGERSLPNVDHVHRVHGEDEDEPHVGPEGEHDGDVEGGQLHYQPDLVRRDGHDADSNNDKQVEGSRADDGRWAELPDVEIFFEEFYHRQADLRG